MWMFLLVASAMTGLAHGFASLPSVCHRTGPSQSALFAATGGETTYPPMSRDEVQAMLDTVPVYAVTEPNQEGLVLVKEKNNPNDIAYFFFSPDAANTVFSPLRQKQEEGTSGAADWSVSAYPLGLVWYELVNDPEQASQGIEYRLLPEPDDLIGAQNLLNQQQKQPGAKPNPRANQLFRSPYNEIPIFVDQFLRVTASDGKTTEEKVPLYIGLKDLMETCNQAIKASGGEYQAAMSAIDLRDLIDEMTQKTGTPNDYRKAILVPPTPDPAKAASAQPAQTKEESADEIGWAGKQSSTRRETGGDDSIATPTASNDWSD
jgi:hypothetical protein